jgi:hypothetical protein
MTDIPHPSSAGGGWAWAKGRAKESAQGEIYLALSGGINAAPPGKLRNIS